MIKLCEYDALIDGKSKGFQVGDVSLFAVKKDGEVYVYLNSCPHLGIELEWTEDDFLDKEGALIQCSTHGALFIIESGECVAGPCLREQLTAVECIVRDNAIYIEEPILPFYE
jgi:nitrite reductase/ring-hydroxylating ferredoxin subunit